MGTRQEELDFLDNIKSILAKQELMNDKLDDLAEMTRELKLTRAGHEASSWGEKVEDMEDVDLEEIGVEATEEDE